jgi:hypothetical protein
VSWFRCFVYVVVVVVVVVHDIVLVSLSNGG